MYVPDKISHNAASDTYVRGFYEQFRRDVVTRSSGVEPKVRPLSREHFVIFTRIVFVVVVVVVVVIINVMSTRHAAD